MSEYLLCGYHKCIIGMVFVRLNHTKASKPEGKRGLFPPPILSLIIMRIIIYTILSAGSDELFLRSSGVTLPGVSELWPNSGISLA